RNPFGKQRGTGMILNVKSGSKTELIDITSRVREAVSSAGVKEGICMVYVPHTTAAVTINESADSSVKRDILMVLNDMVPWKADYRHAEGNSPAHVKSTLVGASELVAVEDGKPVLGTWQGIFFCEFDGPRSRKVHVRFLKGGADG
ncbi:MAG: secondary thiamine-phosphate synthase enzyme YjbQ, partial [Desulfococcaceae bacterium]